MSAVIHIVAVELHHETTAVFVCYRLIPAAPYAQMFFGIGPQHNEARIGGCNGVEYLRRAVGAAVIHYNDVERHGENLTEGRVDGIADCLYPVADRNHHRHHYGVIALLDIHFGFGTREGADCAEMVD